MKEELSEFCITWINDSSEECESELLVKVNDVFDKYVVVYDIRDPEQYIVYDVNTIFSLRLKQDDDDVLVSRDFYILKTLVVVVFKKESCF